MARRAVSPAITVLFWASMLLQAAIAAATESSPDPAAFGRDLVQAFNTRDIGLAASLIDLHTLKVRIARTMFDNPEQVKGFVAGMDSTGPNNLLQGYFKVLDASHGKAKFLRVVESTGEPRVLLRFDLGHGFEYLEFVLQKDETGHYRAIDWWQLSRGELMSATAGAVAKLMFDPDPGLLNRLFGTPQVDQHLLDQMKEIGVRQRAGDYAGALALMDGLPEPIADSQRLLVIRANFASLSGQTDRYKQLLEIMARKYGNDPAAAFVLIDYYVFQHQTDKLLQAITTIEHRVGVDGPMNLLTANAYIRSGSYKQGVFYAQEAVRLEPDLTDGYFSLATGYVGLKQYPQAVAVYQSLVTKFGARFQRQKFVENPQYADFVQSAAFKKWLPN